ncbi:MAG: HRDC domain-containing protein [Methanoregula sp.]|nr:HRDC domain-containing protein [Methanoregula sp.]
MYTRNIVILANSTKYSGHCIAGKDLNTGEWVRLINTQQRPFFNNDLKELYGDPEGPSLLTCVKIPFQEKVPLYYQPENELISGDSWEKIGEYSHEKIRLLEDAHYPCWLGNTAYGYPDRIPVGICNASLPLSVSLHFMKLDKSENNLTLAYKLHENGNKPRLIFYFNNIRYDLGITDITYPRLGDGDDTRPKQIPDSFVTLGVGQLFEPMNSHYKLVVGIIHSENELQGNAEEKPVISPANSSNSTLPGDTSGTLPTPERDATNRSIPQLNRVTTNYEQKLFLELKNLRKSIADQDHVPPYVVFWDKNLREMAQTRPCDLENFMNVDGVGEKKLEKYGLIFTSAIKTFCEENGVEITPPDNMHDSDTNNALEQIFHINQEISGMNNKLKELNFLKNSLLEHVKKTEIRQQGNYILQSSTTSIRQLDLEAFKQRYPQVFMEIGSVTLSDADRILGKTEVTELCTFKESTRYSVKEIISNNRMQENPHE